MAFGNKPRNESTGTTGNRFYPTTVMQLDGIRRFQLLANLEDSTGEEPVEIPVRSYAVWLPVRVGDNQSKRRIFTSFRDRELLPEHIQSKMLSRVFMNVFDLTPVLEIDQNPENTDEVVLAYPDERNQFFTGFGDKRQTHQGKASPNKRIMVLEASASLLTAIEGQIGLVVNMEGEPVEDLLEMQFSARMVADAKDPKRRVATAQGTYIPHIERSIDNLPRYNTKAFAPWPRDAIQALIDGEDFNEVVKTYNIVRSLRDADVF
jgi:hypothetical protein